MELEIPRGVVRREEPPVVAELLASEVHRLAGQERWQESHLRPYCRRFEQPLSEVSPCLPEEAGRAIQLGRKPGRVAGGMLKRGRRALRIVNMASCL